MLDFAWSEFLVVIIVAVIVIGPKQLPDVLYGFGRIVRRLQYMKFAMSKQFEDFMEQADLNEIRNIKKTSFDMALHHGIEEDEVEMENSIARESLRVTKDDGEIERNGERKNERE